MERLLQRVNKRFITYNEELTLITKTREWTERRALQKRDSRGKSSKSIYSAPSKRANRRKLVDQSLQKEVIKLKKTKFEFELIKFVVCFLDGHGNFDNNLVSFKIKLCKLTIL